MANEPAMHAEALRLAAQAGRIHELDHEPAASQASAYANLARALMFISRADAASYFARGVEIVDRVGDEMHYRLSRSEEQQSELPALMRNSYAVFCLKKKTRTT